MIQQAPLHSDQVIFNWEWSLEASPERLWPLISDTNRMNRLARMSTAVFSEIPLEEGGSERTGASKMLGMGIEWDEHPFEWVYPHGFSVLREFHNGVLLAYRSSVTLYPTETGTLVRHRVELRPRLAILAGFVKAEGPRQFKYWDEAYRAVDAYLCRGGPWPFEPAPPRRRSGEAEAMTRDIQEDAPSPELELRLFHYAMDAQDEAITLLKPLALADRWREPRPRLIQACLDGLRRGYLEAQWSYPCPHCRGAKGTVSRLEDLSGSIYCASCNIQFNRASDLAVELTFRPSARYRKLKPATYCVGAPGNSPHVFFQAKLAAGQSREISLSLEPGGYRVRGPRLKGYLNLTYHGGTKDLETLPEIELSAAGILSADSYFAGPKLKIRLVNRDTRPLEVLIETKDWRDDVLTLGYLRENSAYLEALGLVGLPPTPPGALEG
jgi:hypothetical protein